MGTIIKFLIGIVMLGCLAIGIPMMLGSDFSKNEMPTSVADLDTMKVTVKEFDTKDGSSTGILQTEEYPDDPLIMSTKSSTAPNAADITLKPGDQITIMVRKQDVANLKSPDGVIVWGAQDADGKTILDPNQVYQFADNPILKNMKAIGAILTSGAVLYFLCLILLRKKKQNPSGPA